jgi:hypothetical protein
VSRSLPLFASLRSLRGMRRPLLLLLALLQGALLPRSCAGMVGTTLVVIGGGAAGYFGAISAAQAAKDRGKELKVVIVEQLGEPLTKVKISGGGRCNVLHVCCCVSSFGGPGGSLDGESGC